MFLFVRERSEGQVEELWHMNDGLELDTTCGCFEWKVI